MLRLSTLTILVLSWLGAFSQSFLNGSFENNTTTAECLYNISNAEFNMQMADVNAYGVYEALDIIKNGCFYDGIPDGTFAVSIANFPNDNSEGEALALELDGALIAGETYTLSFQAAANEDFGPQGDLMIGLSEENNSFGDLLTIAETVVDLWQVYTVEFVAPSNGSFITVMPAPGVDSWNGIDAFNLASSCSSSGTDVQTACGSFEWIDGITYTESTNEPTFMLENVAGCDSLVTLDLTISDPSFGTDSHVACDSFTWIDGVTYTESTDEPSITLMTAQGCDSLVTLNLEVIALNPVIQSNGPSLQVSIKADFYQWLDCNDDFASIPGATDPSYTPTVSGSYAIVVNVGDCSGQSDCVDVIIEGVEDVDGLHVELEAFPNPTAGELRLIRTSNELATLKLYDSAGRLVKSKRWSTGYNAAWELSELRSGCYSLVYYSRSSNLVRPIVIE